jgi:hypothetical protein
MNQAQAEQQKRNSNQRLLDQAWSLVMEAKNKGFTQQQVINQFKEVVAQAYA